MAAKKKKSTTRSDTSLESLDLYTFYLDRASESQALYDALKGKGAHVERHRDHYKDDEDDPVWLPEVCGPNKILMTSTGFRAHSKLSR